MFGVMYNYLPRRDFKSLVAWIVIRVVIASFLILWIPLTLFTVRALWISNFNSLWLLPPLILWDILLCLLIIVWIAVTLWALAYVKVHLEDIIVSVSRRFGKTELKN
jgi:hypothetical protein